VIESDWPGFRTPPPRLPAMISGNGEGALPGADGE
jgi:hypothetical protein